MSVSRAMPTFRTPPAAVILTRMCPERTHVMDLSETELADFFAARDAHRFHAGNVFGWIYKKGADRFDVMTNLSKALRSELAGALDIAPPAIVDERRSADGTAKLLFRLDDGLHVESVIMPIKDHFTLCVSSQVGCRMGCRFCLTGQQKFERSLYTREIIGQIVACARRLPGGARLTNVVLMGMGEPLDNVGAVLKAARILRTDSGFNLSSRRITLSTVGWIPGLQHLAQQEDLDIALAVSLNAPNDEIRSSIMPVNQKYPLGPLLEELRAFPLRKGTRITMEYVLLGGLNDAPHHADELARRLKGLKCMVNLIAFNAFPGSSFAAPREKDVIAFQERLLSHGYRAMIRRSRGADICAACGQLRGLAGDPDGSTTNPTDQPRV